MTKLKKIFIIALPILVMIGLVPFVGNDYLLTLIYIIVITFLLLLRHQKVEWTIFAIGFVLMLIFEYLFIKTEVEIFIRDSLLGVMPLWLPFLWGYGFVAIKRTIEVIED